MKIYSSKEVHSINYDSAVFPKGYYVKKTIPINKIYVWGKAKLLRSDFDADNMPEKEYPRGYHTQLFEQLEKEDTFHHVIQVGENYELEDGHHRLILLKERGIKEVEVFLNISNIN